MSIRRRQNLYTKVMFDRNEELDLLDTALPRMELDTMDRYRVTQVTEKRLDLISFKYYSSYDYGWLIAEHNDILNPFDEVVVGKVLRIPSLDSFYRFYNRNRKRKSN